MPSSMPVSARSSAGNILHCFSSICPLRNPFADKQSLPSQGLLRTRYQYPLSVAKGPTESRTGTVIALRECCRRASVPASVERKVPREVVDELDIVNRIRIEMDTSGPGDCRYERGRDIQICLFEFECFDLSGDETDCRVLASLIYNIRPVAGVLPT